jgi:hypothetical protein
MNLDFSFQVLGLLLIGFLSGFLNILAGGGSLLTLPMLIFLGLPAAVANGTNRVGILVQNIFAIQAFHRHKVFPVRLSLLCAAPSLVGAYVGANMAVDIDELLFKRILAGIMVGVLLLTLVDPMKYRRTAEVAFAPLRLFVLLVVFFFIGLYGGFVQAGVGFLILSALMLQGLDLVRSNAVKIFVIFLFTLPALAIFAWHGQVNWPLGAALAVGNASGGWLASHMAVKKGHDWIKRVVSLTVLAFAIKLLIG